MFDASALCVWRVCIAIHSTVAYYLCIYICNVCIHAPRIRPTIMLPTSLSILFLWLWRASKVKTFPSQNILICAEVCNKFCTRWKLRISPFRLCEIYPHKSQIGQKYGRNSSDFQPPNQICSLESNMALWSVWCYFAQRLVCDVRMPLKLWSFLLNELSISKY